MGTISNKLTYLNTTKTMLRDSLNKFGSNILTNDTFRSYDTKLNDIYNKLPKVTQSGAGLTISNVQNGQVDDFKMNGVDLEQNTTNGINKFYLNNNYSANYDEASIEVNNNNSFILRMNKTSSNAQSPCATIEFNASYLKPNTTYTISKKNSNTGYVLEHVGSIRLYINGSYGNFIDADEYTFTTPNEITSFKILLYLFFNNSTTGNYEITFYDIQFEENSTATDFEPYTGGIPSPNPDYPQEIKVVEGRQVINVKGENLFNFGIRSRNQNGITTNYNFSQAIINGTTTTANSIVGFTTKISEYSISLGTYSAGSYVFKFEKVSGNLTYPSGASEILIRNSNDTNIFKNIVNSETTNYTKSFTLEQETELFIQWFVNESNWTFTDYICRFMIISDTDSATDYEPYYEPVSYNIDLQLANIYLAKMPDTNYKNRIYKNNGNWYYEKNIEKVVFDGSSDENWQRNETISGENRYYQFYINFSNLNINILDSTCYSKHFKFSRTVGNNFYINYNSSLFVFPHPYNANGDFETVTAWKNWLSQNNDEIYVPIETITTQITNTTLINQLEAISVHTGTNIITISNDNNIIPEIEMTRLKELEKLA